MGLMDKLKRMMGGNGSEEMDEAHTCPECGMAFDTAAEKMEHAQEAHAADDAAEDPSAADAEEA